MRRFLIFPPLFAVWFVAAQFGLTVESFIASRLMLYLPSAPSDVYLHDISIPASSFFAPIVVGAVVGCVFATLDFALHGKTTTPDETAVRLLQNLLKAGVVAVVLVLLYQVGLYVIVVRPWMHRRYHAYPPDMQFLNLVYYVQPLLLLASLFWATVKTLRRPL